MQNLHNNLDYFFSNSPQARQRDTELGLMQCIKEVTRYCLLEYTFKEIRVSGHFDSLRYRLQAAFPESYKGERGDTLVRNMVRNTQKNERPYPYRNINM